MSHVSGPHQIWRKQMSEQYESYTCAMCLRPLTSWPDVRVCESLRDERQAERNIL